jgi:hypothetical protein
MAPLVISRTVYMINVSRFEWFKSLSLLKRAKFPVVSIDASLCKSDLREFVPDCVWVQQVTEAVRDCGSDGSRLASLSIAAPSECL